MPWIFHQRLINLFRSTVLLLLWLGAFQTISAAQQPQAADTATATPTVVGPSPIVIPDAEKIQALLDDLQKQETLDATLEQDLSASYTRTLNRINRAKAEKEKLEKFQKDLVDLPVQTETFRTRLASPPESATLTISEASSSTELELLLARKETELAEARAVVADLDQKIAGLPETRRLHGEKLTAVRETLKAHREARSTEIPQNGAEELLEARTAEWQAREAALHHEIQALEAELPLFDLFNPYWTLSRDLAIRRIDLLEAQTERVRQVVSERRTLEAERAAARARMEARAILQAATSEPAFQDLAEKWSSRNAELAELRASHDGPIKAGERAGNRHQELLAMNRQVTEDFSRIRSRIEAVGLDDAVGPLLRKHRSELPNPRRHLRYLENRTALVAAIEIRRIDLREQRLDLANIDAVVKRELAAVPTPAAEAVRLKQEQLLRELIQSQRTLLEELQSDYNAYYEKLNENNAVERELAREAQAFADFINEHILWIPSGNAFSPTTLVDSFRGLVWFFTPSRWALILRAFWRDIVGFPLLDAAILLFLGFLFVLRPRIIGRIEALGAKASKNSVARLDHSIRALFHTFLLSLPGPALLYLIGWRFSIATSVEPIEPDFIRAVGFGLQVTSLVFLVLNAFRYTLIPKGLAIAHFDWPEAPIVHIRKKLLTLALTALPLVFICATLQWYLTENYQETTGRLLFVILMGVVTAFAHRALNLKGGPFQEILDFKRGSGRSRFRMVWYGAGVGIPLVILALAVLGYYYTALRLAVRFFYTLAFVFVTTVVYGMILRWVALARRDLAMEQARKRREQARAREAEEGHRPEIEIEEEVVDLVRIDFQTRQLVSTLIGFIFIIGVYFIWEEELPALSILNQQEVWGRTTVQTVLNEEGVEVKESVRESITLAHIVLAFLIVLVTIGAVKNIPALLEITIIRRIQLAAGERYAVITLTRYVIVSAGVILALNALGVGWSNLQWLVAAVGLGLGFGLQEIFANFISGLILLFERPIRVGDLVTVGQTSGTVSRINIRATTITDFDRKELIVPNKEFVTGQMVNWTLSDRVLRVVIRVGIAYGSDTELACETLLEVAREHPEVLDDPPPTVLFAGFGASSLDIDLRFFVRNIDELVQAKHQIYINIDKRFREKKIEIAFPQQDLHVRSISDSILEKFVRASEKSSPPSPPE